VNRVTSMQFFSSFLIRNIHLMAEASKMATESIISQSEKTSHGYLIPLFNRF